jgi:hypothetical protein
MAVQVSSYSRAVAVTKSDTTVVGCKGFYVGGAGDVAVKCQSGDTAVTFVACIVGQIYPVEAYIIMSAGTSATNIVALY